MTTQQAIATLRGHLAGVDLPPNERREVQEAFDVLRQRAAPEKQDAWAFKAGKRAVKNEVLGVIEEIWNPEKEHAGQSNGWKLGYCRALHTIKTRIQQLDEEVSQ